MHRTTIQEQLRELERRWATAEIAGDIDALEELATDDFALVGPAGFVLDKQQWLDRYRRGDLVTRSLSFVDPATRVYGDAAITIGRHVQQAEYRSRPADGEFRSTQIAVCDGERWLLAGLHLSPLGGPPRFATRIADEDAHG